MADDHINAENNEQINPANASDDDSIGGPNPAETEESEADEETYDEADDEEAAAAFFDDQNAEAESASQADIDAQAPIAQAPVEDAGEAWKRAKKIKPITPLNTFLTIAVCIFVPWYIYSERQDIAYFFSSGTPVNLGSADEYRLPAPGETAKQQDFTDNTYVTLGGIPIRHVPIQSNRKLLPKKQMLVYQLMGSSVYVQEPFENSQFAKFQSQTSPMIGANTGIEPLEITGRLRRFDTSDNAKRYTFVRDYFSKKYGTVFCENMSSLERQRKAKLLGRGGIALQIMPDGSVLEGDTDTRASITAISPMRGRSAVALGNDGSLLRTIDAGRTWHKAQLPDSIGAHNVTYDASSDTMLLAGDNGFVGGTQPQPSNELQISQSIQDIAIVHADAEAPDAPAIIAVGREGLIETATASGFRPARMASTQRFNDVLYTHGRWFAAGSNSMLIDKPAANLDDSQTPWIRNVSPQNADWLSLTEVPGAIIATGTKGAIAIRSLNDPADSWREMPVDDVPGIDFDADIRASAVSNDGKTWVGVGTKGNIVVAKASSDGNFNPVQRISGNSAGYAVVHDILAGNEVEQALYEALQRHTDEDLYDIAYANGTFFAVGSDSLLMTSKDGYSWTRREMHIKHKLLRAITFVDDMHGVIGGEKGTMFVTEDGGATWRTKPISSERSIYHITASPAFPNGFVFSGAYGLWGFCRATNGECFVRSRSGADHYRAAAFAPADQKDTHLNIVAVGDNAHIDHIMDAPGNQGVNHQLWQELPAQIRDIFVAGQELPLVPNAARGQIALIAADDGSIYRSIDNGYTFKRENSGISAPIRKIAATDDGVAAWAFDRKGTALEDIRSQGKWHNLSNEADFIDGVFIGQTGYLIDSKCVYKKPALTSEFQIIDCTDPDHALLHIAADSPNTLVISALLKTAPAVYQTTTLSTSGDPTLSPFQNLDIPADNAPDKLDSRLIACHGTNAILDITTHKLYTNGTIQTDVADAACDGDKLVFLKTQSVGSGKYQITATGGSALWSTVVGFDPSDVRFYKHPDGRWWLSTASDGTYPLILMSRDGQKWSWRSDRITDYYSVATAQNNAVAVGDDATILVSQDYGATWSQIKTGATQTLRGVCLSQDGTYGLAVGDAGLVYRFSDDIRTWTKLTFKLDHDFTSCAIAESADRFQIYMTGKGGAIHTAHDKFMQNGLELVEIPVLEDIYDVAALETGEVIAVGGVYQDPSIICEEGFIIEAGESPRKVWPTMLLILAMLAFMGYTVHGYSYSFRHRNDFKDA